MQDVVQINEWEQARQQPHHADGEQARQPSAHATLQMGATVHRAVGYMTHGATGQVEDRQASSLITRLVRQARQLSALGTPQCYAMRYIALQLAEDVALMAKKWKGGRSATSHRTSERRHFG